jgi:H/ACA ribonucleoprotein complex subunit 4
MHSRKEYVCVTQLQDGFPESKIEEALDNFRGRIWQKPPVESAVARRLRVREIYSINLLEVERGGKLLLFSVDCEAGTYVRKIVSDLGLVLGTNAEMRELRRVKAGNFVEGDCVTLQELSDCKFLADKGKESLLRDWVQNLEQALHLREAFLLDESAVRACSAGIDVPAQGIARLDAGVNSGDAVALKTLKGELIGVARALLSAQEVEMLYEKNPIALDLERLVRSGF